MDRFTKICIVFALMLILCFLVNDILKNRYEIIIHEKIVYKFDRYTDELTIISTGMFTNEMYGKFTIDLKSGSVR
jgi:hypothetical protein